jgi:putative membrane protein
MRRRVFAGRSPAHLPAAAGATAAAPASVAAPGAEQAPEAAGPAIAAATERELVRLTPRDCLIFGLVENRGVIVIAAVAGLIWESGLFDFDPTSDGSAFLQWARAARSGPWASFDWTPATLLRLIGVFAALVVLVRVLSIGWALVRLYGFTLVRGGDELRSRSGLLSEVRSTIPLRRVQLVTVGEAPLQRLFGRVGVRVETAGGDQDASVTREWLAPVLPRERAPALVAEVLGGVRPEDLVWQPVDPRARRRLLREWLWIVPIVVGPTLPFLRAWSLALVPPLLALAWLGARGQARCYAYAIGPELVGFRSGWLWKHTSYARYGRLQSVALSHSPFDRRWRMATVAGDTAGGGSHRITIPYLPDVEAEATLRRIEARVAATEFRW